MITRNRVSRFQVKIDETKAILGDLEQKVKNPEALRRLGHAKTNLQLAEHAVLDAEKEGNK